jgi:nicotinamidase-related amidase
LAVVLVDMQTGFLDGTPVEYLEQLLTSQTAILRWCGEHDVPVIVLEYGGNGPTIRVLEEVLTSVPRVTRITKWGNDGFRGTALHERLTTLGIKSLVFMGVNASYCVWDTSRFATHLGYTVLTAETLTMDTFECLNSRLDEALDWYLENGTLVYSERELQGLVHP